MLGQALEAGKHAKETIPNDECELAFNISAGIQKVKTKLRQDFLITLTANRLLIGYYIDVRVRLVFRVTSGILEKNLEISETAPYFPERAFMESFKTLMSETDTIEGIEYTQLIITCESCGNVRRFVVHTQQESERLFKEFDCENSCGRNLYSFITVGTLKRQPA
jgi:hypothetical protein